MEIPEIKTFTNLQNHPTNRGEFKGGKNLPPGNNCTNLGDASDHRNLPCFNHLSSKDFYPEESDMNHLNPGGFIGIQIILYEIIPIWVFPKIGVPK